MVAGFTATIFLFMNSVVVCFCTNGVFVSCGVFLLLVGCFSFIFAFDRFYSQICL
jgi:hypothetical protein